MEALVRELEELLYHWRDFDDEIDDAYELLCLDAKTIQFHLPHMDTSPEVDEAPCRLCKARQWPPNLR
jgi:hypothetical protein